MKKVLFGMLCVASLGCKTPLPGQQIKGAVYLYDARGHCIRLDTDIVVSGTPNTQFGTLNLRRVDVGYCWETQK